MKKVMNKEVANILAPIAVDMLLAGQKCTICGGEFTSREEKDNAFYSDKKSFRFAHERCWKLREVKNEKS